MSAQGHRKQVLLFILAVLLPSLVLTAFTWRMIRQEQELAGKRLADERNRAARELGQLLLARLERIKLQEAAAVVEGRSALSGSDYRNPEVVLVGLVESSQLLLPWESDHKSVESRWLLDIPAFAQALSRAEHEEFARGDLSQAADLYRRCMARTRNPVRRGYTQLSLARTLLKLGRTAEAVEQYQNILTLPPSVKDEYGVPLSLYAGRSLIERRIGHADVLDLVRTELQRKEWMSPAASYLLRDLVDTIAGGAPEESVRSGATARREDVFERIAMLEQVLSLQRDFPGLGLAGAQDNHEREAGTKWIAYGSAPWLLSRAPAEDGSGDLLLVVEAQAVLTSLRSDGAFTEAIPGRISLIAGDNIDGSVPGPRFRNLRVDFVDAPQTPAGGWATMRSFYLLALLLVLGVTSFGAHLLWRDVRREVQTAEMRSQFVSSVSHELKTPLTAIRMFAETLSLGRSRSPESHKEYLDTIVNESERLTRLLNNVLDFSKIETGRMAYRLKTTDLTEVIHAAARTMQYPLSQQGFNLNLEIEEGMPAARADRDALEQAVLNLLSNAMKYSGDSRDIDLRLAAKNGQAVIQVTDRGLGIDSGEQERIFEKFYRVRSLENDRITGSGLGLALVDHVIKAHGGQIRVESAPGKGSTFSIYLPLENGT
jgi:signal transduction histidine kinase